MGPHFSEISSGQLALKSALDQAQIEALIREAIALLIESGLIQIPPMRGLRSRLRAGLCAKQGPTTTRPDDRAPTLNR